MKLPFEMTPKLSKILGYAMFFISSMFMGVAFPKVFLFLMICVLGGMGVLYLYWGYKKKGVKK